MKRIELFEFEDFGWLPKSIRTSLTHLLMVLHKILGTSSVVAHIIESAQKKTPFSQIIDLGSGSGGAVVNAVQQINQGNKQVKLVLTDLHPHPDYVKKFNDQQIPHITYSEKLIDATILDQAPVGLKTMMNSFHHIAPQNAKRILKSAQDNHQPILIYEIGENFVPTLIWWLMLPISLAILFIMVLFMTPFVRPLTWKQLLFTYIIPVIPIIYAWDGQASTMRTYTFEDIETLIADFKNDNYTWEINKAPKSNGKYLGYYVLGYPKSS